MFEGIKKRWAEARADVASKEVEDILQRFSKMNVLDRQLIVSAFSTMLFELQDQFGTAISITAKEKEHLAKGIKGAAQKAYVTPGDNLFAHTSRVSAYGGALLALYLELQTFPGDQAVRVTASIEDWFKRAESQLARERPQ
ncbi:MAG: hypothetical protein QOC84_2063 [Bradyrhizobium sp.]|jgi:hypothetical protein|nr:hypothetical protein [Bradyrhizobium sp.]